MQAALQLFEPDQDAFFGVLKPLVTDAVIEGIAQMDSVRLPEEEVRRLYDLRDRQLDCGTFTSDIPENLTYASWIEWDLDASLRNFPAHWERQPNAKPSLTGQGHIVRAWSAGLLIRCSGSAGGEAYEGLTLSSMDLGGDVLWAAGRLIAYRIKRGVLAAPHAWLALAAIAIQFPQRFQTAEFKSVLSQYVASVESVNSQQVQPFEAIGPLAAIVRKRIADLHREAKPRR